MPLRVVCCLGVDGSYVARRFSAGCVLPSACFSLTRPKPEDLPEGASVGDCAGRFSDFVLATWDGRAGRSHWRVGGVLFRRARLTLPLPTLVPETRLRAHCGAEGVSFGATRFGTGVLRCVTSSWIVEL